MMRKREAGNVLVLTGLALTVLLGMAGLSVDVGALRHDKRLQQTAADAAAIAGASDLSPFSGSTAAAKAASSSNGYTDGSNNVTVQVNNPPSSGPHQAGTTGSASYVEVLVTAVYPTYFMRIFGVNTATVTARAVATNSGGGINNTCMLTLGAPTRGIGVNINGSAIVNATTCGIVDDGNFNTSGSHLQINAGTFGVVGGWNSSGNSSPTVTCSESATCPATNIPAGGDPYSYLTPPCTTCVVNSTYTGQSTLSPGVYNGISINSNSTVTFSPGVYVVTGGNLTIRGGGTVTGTGVTFYFTNGATVDSNGNSTITLTAPNSGTYNNILFYQDPNDTNVNGPAIGGNNGSAYDGVLYFPNDDLTFYGNVHTPGSFTIGTVVANSIDFSGNPTINLTGAAGLPGPPNQTYSAVLVE